MVARDRLSQISPNCRAIPVHYSPKVARDSARFPSGSVPPAAQNDSLPSRISLSFRAMVARDRAAALSQLWSTFLCNFRTLAAEGGA
jgi:hypothetical protein